MTVNPSLCVMAIYRYETKDDSEIGPVILIINFNILVFSHIYKNCCLDIRRTYKEKSQNFINFKSEEKGKV
jgi:hypothetical protein